MMYELQQYRNSQAFFEYKEIKNWCDYQTILYEHRTVVFIKVCKICKHGGLLVYSQLTSVSKVTLRGFHTLNFLYIP